MSNRRKRSPFDPGTDSASLIRQAREAARGAVQDFQKRIPPELAARVDSGQRRLQERLARPGSRAEFDALTRRLDALTLKMERLEKLVTPASGSGNEGPLGTPGAEVEPALATRQRRPARRPIVESAREGLAGPGRRPRRATGKLETPTENQVARPPASRRTPAGTPPSASAETSAETSAERQAGRPAEASGPSGPSEA